MRLTHPRNIPDKVSKVGLLVPDIPGAAFYAGALPPQLRSLYPSVHITAFIHKNCWSAMDLVAGIDDVLVLPDRNHSAALSMLRRHPVDVLIDLSATVKVALLARLSGARFVVGFGSRISVRARLRDAAVSNWRGRTSFDAIRALTKPLGTTAEGLPQLDPALLEDAAARSPAPTVLLCPWGQRGAACDWPQLYWEELAKMLIEAGFTVTIVGDAPNYARAKDLEMSIGLPGIEVAVGKTTLRQIATRLARSSCLIGAEGEVLHLANILGTPVVALMDSLSAADWYRFHTTSVALSYSPTVAEVMQICLDISRAPIKASSPEQFTVTCPEPLDRGRRQ